MNVLIVLTSHDLLGETGEPTGFWLEELASPYYRFLDAGARVTLASPKGGRPPLDPKSSAEGFQTDATRRFEADARAMEELGCTVRLAEVDAGDFDAVFYPGGHGPLWDLAVDADSIALVEAFLASKKPVAAVCHAPAALVGVKGADGRPLAAGKRMTAFSNSEEIAVELNEVVPFLLEDRLTELGAAYEKGEDWSPHVVVDGLLVTGQNPASSEGVADALLELAGRA
jgi:putative intracellular protease/amidase